MSTLKFMTAALLLLDLSSFVIAQTSNGNCNSAECVYTGLTASILSFQYAIPGGKMRKNCPLSVYLTTDTIRSLLWNSMWATRNNYTQAQMEISSPDHPFKILIEGKTTDNEPCASGGSKISIDNIMYEGVAPPTLSPPESTATSESHATSDTSSIPSAVSSSACDETLNAGVATGIGVGAVVVIALIVAALLNLRKGRTRKDKTKSQLASEETANTDTLERVVNASYQADNGHTTDVADTGLVYNGPNEVHPVTAPSTTQSGGAGQRSASAVSNRRGTEELYMNVDPYPGLNPEVCTISWCLTPRVGIRQQPLQTCSLPEESSSARTDTVTAETYDGLSARPDSKFYTTLTTKHPASTSETYEGLAPRPESKFYTDLATERTLQPDSTPENYELLTVTPESSHYTALTKSGHNMIKSK
ncbi:hypothetical protein BaRGS_00036633 [Batillaria attramentaria]|uniref:Uncharacterized protein n=1 Tax=Batillaria attramentaria TaxID=370345 RepID=A0ABD0JBE6_9CAEN